MAVLRCVVIFWQLLVGSYVFADVLPDKYAYDKMDPMVFYAIGNTFNNTRRYVWTAQEACVGNMPETYTRGNYTYEYSNPRVGEKQGLGVGCYYHYRRIYRNGSYVVILDDVPNWFCQHCFYLVKACETGWILASDGKCSRLRIRPYCPNPVRGNPVVVATGAKVEREVDLEGMLPIHRSYSSRSYIFNDGMFGNNWFFDRYERSLVFDTQDLQHYVVAVRSVGREVIFKLNGSEWDNISWNTDVLRSVNDQSSIVFEYRSRNNNYTEKYDVTGKLLEIVHDSGKREILSYSNSNTSIDVAPYPGLLIGIATQSDNSLSIRYNELGKVIEIIDGAGQIYQYSYEARHVHNVQSSEVYLSNVTYPDEYHKTYHYELESSPTKKPLDNDALLNPETINDLGSIYLTIPSSLAELVSNHRPGIPNTGYAYHPMTGITDENGIRISSWEYNSEGKVITSEHHGNTDRTEFSYFTSGISSTNTVTDTLGNQTSYNYVLRGDEMTLESIQHLNGETHYSFDGNSFLNRKQDQNNNITTYTRDAQGRELSRTEASGTPEARTITTTWDTTLNKPLVVTEPNQITEYKYDGEGRLLSKTQKANWP
ncbi:MAG: hypothetical protein K1563_12745 [Candidatus Thiodiazotropha sp. (ex. Lucinisca nassula)]|nr:hypothetical protein [Candidatus Thiodiazotropha sp. (ex. Lucinisca nassula)]